MKFLTHLIQRRRGPTIVQYTDIQEHVTEQRTWFLLLLLTLSKILGACVGPSLLTPKTNGKEGDAVGKCYSQLIRASVITPSLVRFVLVFFINLFFGNEQF